MGIFNRARKGIRGSAGQVVKGGSAATPEAILRRRQDWQRRVLSFADSVPEVSAASAFLHNTIGRVEFEIEGVQEKHAEVLERTLRSFPAGRAAENLFLVGECLAAWKYDAAGAHTTWEIYGFDDWKLKGKDVIEVRGANGKWRPLEPGWSAFRMWRPDRSNRFEAWSPHKSMLELLEAMYLHQLADTAVATSRLAGAGILYVPNDGMVSIPVPDGGQPEPGTEEELRQHLVDAMMTSIRDRGGADAVIPLVLFGNAEFAGGLKHLLMERSDDAQAFATRMKAYRERYASGIDLPAEIVTGMTDANHWTAWKVDQNTWKYYLEPMAQLIADALNESYVKNIAGVLGANPINVRVCVEGTKVIAKPDRTDAAIRLRQLGVLTAEAAAKAAGFEESDIEKIQYDPTTTKRLEPLPAEVKDGTGDSIVAGMKDRIAESERMLRKRLSATWRIWSRRESHAGAAETVRKIVTDHIEEKVRAACHSVGQYPGEWLPLYSSEIARRADLAAAEFDVAIASSAGQPMPGYLLDSVLMAAGGPDDDLISGIIGDRAL